MAEYTLSSYNKRIVLFNLGSPFGYVAAALITINDAWGVDLVAGDKLILPLAIKEDIKTLTDIYPVAISCGGNRSNFNDGNFSGYTYPITSTPDTHGTYATVSENSISASLGGLNITIRFGGATGIEYQISSNRNNARIRPFWLISDINGRLFNYTSGTVGPDLRYNDTSTNSYLAADNAGMPYNTTSGTYLYSQDATTLTLTSNSINLSDLDWKESAIPTDDPYGGAGESEPDGGDGNFDFSSTVIPIPGLPNIGATDTGFISLYKPSATQLKALANYMWAGAFDVAQFKKLFADPMDAILGLHIIPTVTGHPTTGSGNLLVGNIDTGLTMPTCLEQYYEADFGEVAIPAKWGAYLDYSPYTKLSLYLPYIGFVPLSADDCMRGSIKVVYHVDVLSGTCMAFVYCVSNRGTDGHTLYMFNGSCSCDCPVTSGQYRSALEGLLGVAGSIGRVAAGDVAGGLKDAISNVTAMLKPEIGRSGSFGGSGGLMGIQYPYLVLTVPRMAIPGQQNTFIGYPSFVTKTIGDLTGYCSIDVSHLNNMPCTQAETDEIISLLEEGVIL